MAQGSRAAATVPLIPLSRPLPAPAHALPHLREPRHHAVVHPHVARVGEGVAVLLADGHAGVGGAHVREHQRGHDLAGQARQVLVVPASGHA